MIPVCLTFLQRDIPVPAHIRLLIPRDAHCVDISAWLGGMLCFCGGFHFISFIHQIQFLIINIQYTFMDSSLNHPTAPSHKHKARQYSTYLQQHTGAEFPLTQSSHPTGYFHEFPSQPPPSADLMLSGEHKKSSDVRSLIEQLMKSKDVKVHHPFNFNSAQPVLVKTEEKIFQEVVNLLLEIDDLKNLIHVEKQDTMKLEVARDNLRKQKNVRKKDDFDMESIINRLKSKQGEQLKLSAAEIDKITAENQYLQEQIHKFKMMENQNLNEVFEAEKKRYEELKGILLQKKKEIHEDDLDGSEQQILDEIQHLKHDIQRLQGEGINVEEEVGRLNAENEILRSKTIDLLSWQGGSEEEFEERKRLREYIQKEQQSKQLFYQDLKRFKTEYNRLKQQNEELKSRVRSKLDSYPEYLGTQSRTTYENKFNKYENLVYKMQNILK